MNKYTLTFKNKEIEKQFGQYYHPLDFKKLSEAFYYAILCLVITSIYNFLYLEIVKGIIYLLFAIFMFIIIKLSQRSSVWLNSTNFLSALTSNIILLLLISPKNQRLSNDTFKGSDYYIGMICAYFHFVFLSGSKYYLKKIAILINGIFVFSFFVSQDGDFKVYPRYVILLATFCLDRTIYQQDHVKRKFFILMQNNSQWQKGLEENLDIPVFQGFYDMVQDQLNLIKANVLAKELYKINTDQQLRNFCRQFIIYDAQQKNRNQLANSIDLFYNILQQQRVKKKLMNLEKFIYLLLKKTEIAKKLCKMDLQNIYNCHLTLEGQFDNKYLRVKLFCIYDEQVSIVFRLEEQENCDKLVKMRAKQKIYDKILEKLQLSYKKTSYKSLIDVKVLLEQRKNQNQTLKIQNSLKSTNFFQYLAYNNYLNIACFTNKFDFHNQISQFKISDILNKLKTILEPMMSTRKIKMMILKNERIDEITSCQWKFYQILFNLLINSIKYSKQSSVIVIKYKIRRNKFLNNNSIIIKILEESIGISQKQIDQLPIINPKYLWEYYLNQQAYSLKLGLTISSYLLNHIGPSSRIKYKIKGQQQQIRLIIYQNAKNIVGERFLENQRFRPHITLRQMNYDFQ